MLHINDLSYRIEGKPILDGASAAIPAGHKVGLIGRNGAGKTTLLKLILGDLAPDSGTISWPRNARLGHVAQEAPGGPDSLIEWVLSADAERAALLKEAETATDPIRIADIQVRLTDIDAHSAPARAASILSGLGFDHDAQQRACSEFSGGWRMRVALAGVLLTQPEILLLDEPTNYLDLEGTIWLENHLRTYPETVIIVSHDRDLLNSAVSSILHLHQGALSLFAGGYDAFEDAQRERQRLEGKLRKKQDSERQRLQAFIDRFKAKATKAKQAQSRVKALARMKPIAAATVEDTVTPFLFPTPDKPLASPIVRMETASVGYEPEKPVLKNLDLRIDRDDRIALLGANGNGKSTFAKLIAGRLKPLSGLAKPLDKLKVGYFAQHQLDELNERATPYDYIAALLPDATEAQKRSRLAGFGFGAQKAETRCENLSGGEKARLMLALTAFHAPHLMILDEPTNHLDVDSRQALIQALAEYDGAVLLISHDRHLVEATADRLWVVGNNTVRVYDGDIDTYRSELLRSRSSPSAGIEGHDDTDQTTRHHDTNGQLDGASPAERRKAAAAKRAELAPLKKALTKTERLLEKLSGEIDQLDQKLAAPGLFTDEPDKAQEFLKKRGELAKKLAGAEDDWLAATDAFETAEAALEQMREAQ